MFLLWLQSALLLAVEANIPKTWWGWYDDHWSMTKTKKKTISSLRRTNTEAPTNKTWWRDEDVMTEWRHLLVPFSFILSSSNYNSTCNWEVTRCCRCLSPSYVSFLICYNSNVSSRINNSLYISNTFVSFLVNTFCFIAFLVAFSIFLRFTLQIVIWVLKKDQGT